jgi:hypothetical protein
MEKNKLNIPLVKNTNIFDTPLNCIDHYNTLDTAVNYRRTLNRFGNTGIYIRKLKNEKK